MYALQLRGAVLCCGAAQCRLRDCSGESRRDVRASAVRLAVWVGGPVYHDCAVDQPARREGRGVYPESFEPRMPSVEVTDQCYRAEIQFVMDTLGRSGVTEARIVRTEHPEFADAVLATLPRCCYRPARKDGAHVRQIVREGRAMVVRVVAADDAGRASRVLRC